MKSIVISGRKKEMREENEKLRGEQWSLKTIQYFHIFKNVAFSSLKAVLHFHLEYKY